MTTARPLATTLPRPGPAWGGYPLRPAHAAPPVREATWRTPARRCKALAARSFEAERRWAALAGPAAFQAEAAALRGRLRRQGLVDETTADALGAVADCARRTLGWAPRANQRAAAAALLDGRMAEMATGEGKTLAIALAAAVAALAGVPVHVVTANAYLAARDAAHLAPFYAALGLTVAALVPGEDEAARRAAYARDVAYATARDLAFDHLRDGQAANSTYGAAHDAARAASALTGGTGPRPLMRGLCMAILDEADGILLDEAEVPLILSRDAPHAARRAFLWQALAIARQLEAGTDFHVHPGERSVVLHGRGEERLAALAAPLGGPWQRPRYRREAVTIALAALHAHRRDEHYVVREGQVEILDEVTGRIAEGRRWSRGLHTVVALKEGLAAPAETETLAQITFQRFFLRYWRLAGLSGTLREARAELRSVYGLEFVAIAPHRPSRRRTLPPRRFADAAALHAAVAERAGALRAAGRPVLIGTDSVADSQAVARALAERGVPHAVLNALNDAQEAAIVARAGAAGQVTVATRMAGRGTDIALDERARAAGGLHVIDCQRNPSHRLDRQLAGRAARAGDPGSVEKWATGRGFAFRLRTQQGGAATNLAPWHAALPFALLDRLARCMARLAQRREERRRALLRRALLQQDLQWERRLAFAGKAS
jgi:preprotein translocase subunit SecA